MNIFQKFSSCLKLNYMINIYTWNVGFFHLVIYIWAFVVSQMVLPAMWIGKIPWKREWHKSMDRGVCWATVHGVTKSHTWLKQTDGGHSMDSHPGCIYFTPTLKLPWLSPFYLLDSAGNSIQYLVITYNGKELEKYIILLSIWDWHNIVHQLHFN